MPAYQVMSFADIVAAVIVDTARPDMGFIESGGTGEIPRAVQSATLKMHGLDFFYKDVIEAQAIFNTLSYLQTLDVTTLPRYRNIAYLRKWDPMYNAGALDPTLNPQNLYNYASATALLKSIDIDDIIDNVYKVMKTDVYYQAGTTINIRSSTALQYALMGWYAFPNVDITNQGVNYSSWIAQEYPYAIIYDADSKIFSSIGQQDQSRKYDSPATPGSRGGLVQEQVEMILANNIRVGAR